MVKFKDFLRHLRFFQELFKANLIFKDFQDSPVYSSIFKPVRTLCDHNWRQTIPIVAREMSFSTIFQLCQDDFLLFWVETVLSSK